MRTHALNSWRIASDLVSINATLFISSNYNSKSRCNCPHNYMMCSWHDIIRSLRVIEMISISFIEMTLIAGLQIRCINFRDSSRIMRTQTWLTGSKIILRDSTKKMRVVFHARVRMWSRPRIKSERRKHKRHFLSVRRGSCIAVHALLFHVRAYALRTESLFTRYHARYLYKQRRCIWEYHTQWQLMVDCTTGRFWHKVRSRLHAIF